MIDILTQQDAFFGVVKSIEVNHTNILLEVPVNEALGLHKSLRKKETVSWLIQKIPEDLEHATVRFADGSCMTLSITASETNTSEVRLHELRVDGLRLLARC